jgi:PAS domain S-box-containing protein
MTLTSADLIALRAERDQLAAELAAKERQIEALERNLTRAVAESYALYMTGLDVTSQLDLPTTLQSILRRLKALIRADASLIYLYDPASGMLTVAAAAGVSTTLIGTGFLPANSPYDEVQQFGVPTVLDDYRPYAQRLHKTDEMAFRNTVLLPLRWQGSVIGVIALHYREAGNTFALDDLDSLQHVAVQAAIAIHNATQFAAEQARSRQLAMLFQAATYVTGSLEANTVLQNAAKAIVDIVWAPLCRLYEYNPKAGLQLLADYRLGIGNEASPFSQWLPKMTLEMASEGHWMVIQQSDPFLQPEMASYLARQRAYSILVVPLRLPNGGMGLAEIIETNNPRQFSLADINAVQALVAHTSTALGHAQLHAEVRAQRVHEQAILFKLAQRLLEPHSVREVCERAMESIAEAFNSNYAALITIREDKLEVAAVVGEVLEPFRGKALPMNETTAIGYTMRHGDLVVLDDCLTETRFRVLKIFEDAGMRSALLSPIQYNDRVFGVLAVARPIPHGFNEDDVRLLRLMIYQVAVAIERAQLFESVQAQNLDLEARVVDRTREILIEKDRTETVLEAVGESIIVFDRKGAILQVNRAFETQHGYRQGDVIGRYSEDILGVDLFKAAGFYITPDFSEWRGELSLTRHDGRPYDAAVTLSPLLDEGGGAVASLRDITYLRELDRMKTTFVSNVSHELRTPLANVKLYLHLLKQGIESRRPHYMATLQREMDRVQALIEDLLTISRLDQNRSVPTMETVDVNELVGTLVEDRRYLAQERGLSLEYIPSEHHITADADPKMLMQALGNLLANAMNYTPQGGKIWVTTAFEASGIAISVRDTGLGISPEDQARLFDRFYRGEAARITGSAGTGLGMSIVQEIMNKHGGHISFESVLGQGSTFRLHLPLKRQM